MTNREWFNSLSNSDLALFLSTGLGLVSIETGDYVVTTIKDIAIRYTMSSIGIEKWFDETQEFKKQDAAL